MATNSFKFYPEIIKNEMIETVQKNIQAFNSESSPFFTLNAENRDGELLKETYLDKPSDLVDRADRNSDTTEKSLTSISESERVHARIEATTKRYTEGRIERVRAEMSAEEISQAIGTWSAEGLQQDYVESAASAAVGFLKTSGLSDVRVNKSASITPAHLNEARRTHGDQGSDVGLIVGPSEAYYDLVSDNLNASTTDLVRTSAIEGNAATLGLPFLRADLDAFYEYDSNNNVVKYNLLVLRSGGVRAVETRGVEFTEDLIQSDAGNRTTVMGDYIFDVELRGADYEGPTNPTISELEDSSNWNFPHSNVKYSPGALLQVDPA